MTELLIALAVAAAVFLTVYVIGEYVLPRWRRGRDRLRDRRRNE